MARPNYSRARCNVTLTLMSLLLKFACISISLLIESVIISHVRVSFTKLAAFFHLHSLRIFLSLPICALFFLFFFERGFSAEFINYISLVSSKRNPPLMLFIFISLSASCVIQFANIQEMSLLWRCGGLKKCFASLIKENVELIIWNGKYPLWSLHTE